MDGYGGKGSLASGMKRKREISPQGRESGRRGSFFDSYHGPTKSNTHGHKGERYVSRDQGTANHQLHRNTPTQLQGVPTGPRVSGKKFTQNRSRRKNNTNGASGPNPKGTGANQTPPDPRRVRSENHIPVAPRGFRQSGEYGTRDRGSPNSQQPRQRTSDGRRKSRHWNQRRHTDTQVDPYKENGPRSPDLEERSNVSGYMPASSHDVAVLDNPSPYHGGQNRPHASLAQVSPNHYEMAPSGEGLSTAQPGLEGYPMGYQQAIDHTSLPAGIPQGYYFPANMPMSATPFAHQSFHVMIEAMPASNSDANPNPASEHLGAPRSRLEDLPRLIIPQEPPPPSPSTTSPMSISSGSSPRPAYDVSMSPPPRSIQSPRDQRAKTCIRCKSPAAFLMPLVQCTACKYHYHPHCHCPVITTTQKKPNIDTASWECSRCTKSSRRSGGPKLGGSSATPTTLSFSDIATTSKRRKVGSEASSRAQDDKDRDSSPHTPMDIAQTRLSPMVNLTSPLPPAEPEYNLSTTSTHAVPSKANRAGETQQRPEAHTSQPIVPDPEDNTYHLSNTSIERLNHNHQSHHHRNSTHPPSSPAERSNFSTLRNMVQIISFETQIPEPIRALVEEHERGEDDEPMSLDSEVESDAPQSLRAQSVLDIAQISEKDSTSLPVDGLRSRTSNPPYSPPYSPRLEDESSPEVHVNNPQLSNNATSQEPSIQGLQTTAAVAPYPQYAARVQVQPFVPPPPPAHVVPPVQPIEASIQALLGPTTTLQCVRCMGPFTVFINAARAGNEGSQFCPRCLIIHNTPLLSSPQLPKNDITQGRLSITSDQTRDDQPKPPASPAIRVSNTIPQAKNPNSVTTTANRIVEAPRTTVSPTKEAPAKKHITSAEMLAEKYRMEPEIFPSTSMFSPSKDPRKANGIKSATALTEKLEPKENHKRKLTVEQYTKLQRQRVSGGPFKLIDVESSSTPKRVPESNVTESIHVMEEIQVTLAESNQAGKSSPALLSTEIQLSASEQPLNAHEKERLIQEASEWKDKYEQQVGFVKKYVKANNKMQEKLTGSEKQKSELARRIGELEQSDKEKATLQRRIAELEEKTAHAEASERRIAELEQKVVAMEAAHREQQAIWKKTTRQSRKSQGETQAPSPTQSPYETAPSVDGASRDMENDESQTHTEGEDGESEERPVRVSDLYKHLAFEITDPLANVRKLPELPPPPAVIPPPRYSVTRKSGALQFNSSNMNRLHVHREVDRTVTRPPLMGTAFRVNADGTEEEVEMSFAEFARIPENMVPVIRDGALAFRSGEVHPRSRRLERNVPHYKVGRNVPGELRDI